MSVRLEDLSWIVPAVYDIPVRDAQRILGTTYFQIKKVYGGGPWPLLQLRKGCFSESWDDIMTRREKILENPCIPPEARAALMEARKLAWLFRQIYSCPSQAPVQADSVQEYVHTDIPLETSSLEADELIFDGLYEFLTSIDDF